MSSSQSNSGGAPPDKDPAATPVDPRLTSFLTMLAELGDAYWREGDRHKPDPTRVRVAQDYDVLRGLLGRPDAPRPLRMSRPPGGVIVQKGKKDETSDNVIVVKDPLPASASKAEVESLGSAAGRVVDEFHVQGGDTPTLQLKLITPAMPISRVEIYDKEHTLVAFGPSAAPIA
jgi:hypothetical protein